MRLVLQEVTIARSGHPVRPFEMRAIDCLGAGAIAFAIEVKHDCRDLFPVGTSFFSVEQAQIGDEVLAVILGEMVAARNILLNVGI